MEQKVQSEEVLDLFATMPPEFKNINISEYSLRSLM